MNRFEKGEKKLNGVQKELKKTSIDKKESSSESDDEDDEDSDDEDDEPIKAPNQLLEEVRSSKKTNKRVLFREIDVFFFKVFSLHDGQEMGGRVQAVSIHTHLRAGQ